MIAVPDHPFDQNLRVKIGEVVDQLCPALEMRLGESNRDNFAFGIALVRDLAGCCATTNLGRGKSALRFADQAGNVRLGRQKQHNK